MLALKFLIAVLVDFLSLAVYSKLSCSSCHLDTPADRFLDWQGRASLDAWHEALGRPLRSLSVLYDFVLLEWLLLPICGLPKCVCSIKFDLLSGVQLLQILPLLYLDRFAIELNELWSGQRDDLVAILGRLFNDWIPQHCQISQTNQSHEHRCNFVFKLTNQVVIQIQCYQILQEVEWLAADQVHLGQIEHFQRI